jgi:hypothetical protein
MAVKFFRKKTLFAKLEDDYGVAETLAVTDAMRTRNLTFDDNYAGDRIQRNLDRPTLGLEAEINVSPYAALSFEIELAGAGVAGTIPRYGRLLRACGWTETLDNETAPTLVEYEENEELQDSLTMAFELDGRQQMLPGARGSVELNWPQKGIPFYKFTFWAKYVRPTNATVGTADFSGIPSPVPVTKANTTFAIDAYEGPTLSVTVNTNMELVVRNIIGMEEILLTDRQPTGTLVIDEPDIADLDLFAEYIESHAELNYAAVELVHGTVAGGIVTFENPQVQLSSAQSGEESKIAIYNVNARFIGTSKLTVA